MKETAYEKIKVHDVIGKSVAADRHMGTVLYNEICSRQAPALEIDFSGIDIMTPGFLKEGIGKLFINAEAKDVVSKPLKFSQLAKTDVQMLKLVIANAIRQKDMIDLHNTVNRKDNGCAEKMSALTSTTMYAG